MRARVYLYVYTWVGNFHSIFLPLKAVNPLLDGTQLSLSIYFSFLHLLVKMQCDDACRTDGIYFPWTKLWDTISIKLFFSLKDIVSVFTFSYTISLNVITSFQYKKTKAEKLDNLPRFIKSDCRIKNNRLVELPGNLKRPPMCLVKRPHFSERENSSLKQLSDWLKIRC